MRDLCRAREDAHGGPVAVPASAEQDAAAAGAGLDREVRRGRRGHRLWLRSLRFEQPADQVVLEDYLLAIEQVEQRLKALEPEIEALAKSEPYRPRVGALALLPWHRHPHRHESWRSCMTSCALTRPDS